MTLAERKMVLIVPIVVLVMFLPYAIYSTAASAWMLDYSYSNHAGWIKSFYCWLAGSAACLTTLVALLVRLAKAS